MSNTPPAWISNGGGAELLPSASRRDGDVDLPATDDVLDEDLIVVASGGAQCFVQLDRIPGQRDAIAGPGGDRFDDDV